MSLLSPHYVFRRITDISPEFLRQKGIKALILDIDNTLTGHGSQVLSPQVEAWLEQMRQSGVRLTVSSNNLRRRVEPFAKKIGLDYVAFSCKPSPHGLWLARRRLGVRKKEVAMVGDQIFTDVLGARCYGITVLLVEPMYEDTKWTIRLKRRIEKKVLVRYYKKGGQRIG